MEQIKFSHNYPKLHNQCEAILIEIKILIAETIPKVLREYDTYYDDNGVIGYYTLQKKGKLIQLIFYGCSGIPFCTIRRYTPEKYLYYTQKRGYKFDVVFPSTTDSLEES